MIFQLLVQRHQILVLNEPFAALATGLCMDGLAGQIEIAGAHNVHPGRVDE